MIRKAKCIFAFMACACLVQAVHLRDYERGILKRSHATAFFSDEMRSVSIEKTNPFSMRSIYGAVIIDGKGWDFDPSVIHLNDLQRANHKYIKQSDIFTAVGCYNGKQYNFDFIKHKQSKVDHLRIISITASMHANFNLCPFCNRMLP